MQNYYKLIATGLGCLEAVLKVEPLVFVYFISETECAQHFKMQPQLEAVVRLKYATILYEETENAMEAEEALSKGVLFECLENQSNADVEFRSLYAREYVLCIEIHHLLLTSRSAQIF